MPGRQGNLQFIGIRHPNWRSVQRVKAGSCYVLTGVVLILLACAVQAELRFERLSMADGLSQSSISAMVQDRDGYLWFGTQYGLNRYDGYRFRTYRHDPDDPDSLSSSAVTDLLLTRTGHLWVATRDGLNRLEPRSGKNERFGVPPASQVGEVGWTRVDIIGETSDGRLFLRLARSVAVWDPSAQAIERVPFEDFLTEEQSRSINGVLDSDERLWVANAGGLWRMDSERLVLQRVDGDRLSSTEFSQRLLAATGSGTIALALDHGLALFNAQSAERIGLVSPSRRGAESDRIDALEVTSDGSLWLTVDQSVVRFRPDRDEWQVVWDHPSRLSGSGQAIKLGVAEISAGEVWLATQHGLANWQANVPEVQVFRHEPTNDGSIPSTLSTAAYSLFVDQHETLWIGSQLGGLARLPAHAMRFEHIQDTNDSGSIPFAGHNVIRGIAESEVDGNEHLWLGLDSAGLRQLRRQADGSYEWVQSFHASASPDQGLPGNQVWALAADPLSDQVWAGIDTNLVMLDERSGKVMDVMEVHPDRHTGRIHALLFSADGARFWVGHSQGVEEIHLDAARRRLPQYNERAHLPGLYVINLLELPDGRLAAGGQHGVGTVNVDDPEKSRLLLSTSSTSLSNLEVFGLAANVDGGLWIGTRENGLAHLSLMEGPGEPAVRWYDGDDGLIDETIYAILPEPGGRLWLSSNRGLMRFDPANGEVRHFTPPDGIQHYEFNNAVAHIGPSGRFYFGGINGVNAFHPESIRVLAEAPQVRLDSVLVNGQPRELESVEAASLTLNHSQNDLEATFVGLHSADPERHRYQYQFQGLDESWRDSGFQRQIRYAGLSPGTYRLIVRASNSDGVWSDDTLLLTATIRPPPWRTAWAYLAYVLIFGLVLALIWFMARRRQRVLELEVQSRTAELTQQQAVIRKQARQLARLLESRTVFFANVSHEFRTPLTLIKASLDRLEEDGGDSEAIARGRRYLGRVLRLVDQLLNLSAIQAGKVGQEERQWSVTAVLEFIVASFRSLADQQGIRLDEDIAPDCVTRCGQQQVEQIILNLISNALKYSPGGASVSVKLRPVAEGLCLEVADTGPGIDLDKQEQIFERFHRLESAQLGDREGAGIGLALVRETTEALGGRISLDSSPGRGSRFTVILPGRQSDSSVPVIGLADPDALNLETSLVIPESLTSDVERSLEDGQPDGRETVLVVEDNPDLRAYLAEILAPDWHVLSARDGQEALEIARREGPAVVVSDLMMPRMDGFQLLAALRKDLATSHIPILLLTARQDQATRLKGLMLSADDFLGKPFDGRELLIRLRRIRDNRQRLRQHLLRSSNGAAELDDTALPDISERDRALLASVEKWLERHAAESQVSVEQLADALALEKRTLQRKLKALVGKTPTDYIRHFRLQRAMRLMLESDRSINDIALSCGFSSPQAFSRMFSRQYGESPDRWRQNQRK